ncbi:MAG: S-methyl-5'-thioadenosine phosphorylase [Phycisphaerae bacterium]|nr:S-methyl-5'-thioadenosine phosphorylase [Phycisphaerae bacterium]
MDTIARLGIIGGSGLGQALTAQGRGEWVDVDTPFGRPSGKILLTDWSGTAIAFLSRHGPGHLINPSMVNYRANIYALKKLGVRRILASGATGSLREDVHPGELVVADQVIDKTFRRAGTFFDKMACHAELAEPFCPALRKLLIGCADQVSTRVHDRGTYVCMEGPQFSTRAESLMHRTWGGDLIGMTCMPEAKLAREAEMCYALLALPTDYDCWKPHEGSGSKEQLLTTILGNLQKATDNAVALLKVAAARIGGLKETCDCQDALKLAIWSDKTKVDPAEVRKLDAICGRYFT